MSRLAAAIAALTTSSAFAVDPAILGSDLGVEPSKELAEERRVLKDFVVAPIPISNPTVGTGLAVVAMPFYNLERDSPLSNTAVAVGLTSNGSWGATAVHMGVLEAQAVSQKLNALLGSSLGQKR